MGVTIADRLVTSCHYSPAIYIENGRLNKHSVQHTAVTATYII
jgi:hypothetical protein